MQPLKSTKHYEYNLQVLDTYDLPILKEQDNYELRSDIIKSLWK